MAPFDSFGQRNYSVIYGTVAIDKNSAIDATEVTIYEWTHFIINNDFSKELFPDDLNISNSAKLFFEDLRKGTGFTYIELANNSRHLRENYGSKGFRLKKEFEMLVKADTNYFSIHTPIVGVSFLQAQKFCKWRESVVNTYKTEKVTITLPTAEIYEKLIENKDSINAKNCFLQNSRSSTCLADKKAKFYRSQGKSLLRADSYWPSELGLYCLQGNASEMTDREGVAVGGSFRHYAVESFRDRRQKYSKQEDWLGFRCLVTLK